ncbi:hypothetical protein HGP16_31265 [Rhizobium sp. P40RR-XXII]|uniref:hypothetical protein n=1 Tax=unclassified Rhizobium TaxID=2613769 RepID=UPI001456AACB|nr:MULTISPECIES: hypothetical protein [unclassified Rhizobium]NLR89057.1 hypothetical protein [Rhizobium sp. P28RR-XV]NLS20987.1 hypothetical protein [Rhizobium sp. P40RR-XXII]
MRGRRQDSNGVLLAIFCLMVSCWPFAVAAHGGASSDSQAGISIPSLTHGEMAVIAPYYGRIISLAESASDTDETFRRLLNFAQIQRTYCLWGMVPGSVGDEESPFNECSHAYLAAVKAVLLQMRTMKDEKAAAGDIVSDVDSALVRNNLSLILCKFSGEGFNTADLIRPKPADILLHARSLTTILAAGLVVIAGLWVAARALRAAPRP